jgi:hypothetical protein
MARKLSSFKDVADAFSAFENGEIAIGLFDDALHVVLSHHLHGIAELLKAPRPVALFYAARYIEFEVGNGGFSQAAYNRPDWFGLAAEGYREFGLPQAAQLIDKAAAMLASERRSFTATEIGELFEQFQESKLAELDNELDSCGWWATEQRIAYVMANRESFLEPDYRIPG